MTTKVDKQVIREQADKNWRLWTRHRWGGGWQHTRETCDGSKTRPQAMAWARHTVLAYRLSAMLYTVLREGEEPSDAVKGNKE